jgi:ferritin
LWDACCLFQQFAKNSFTSALPYLKKLEEETKTKNKFFGFQKAVLHLNWFITTIKTLENQSYSPTLFLKSGKAKQKSINQLINNLKSIPIQQVDTSSINSTFEQWKKEHQLMIDEPRYRLLIKLCMLIYRQFMKIFFPASNCFTTTSHQTINKLQEEFLKASEHLQNLRNNFSYSVHTETTAAKPACTPAPP